MPIFHILIGLTLLLFGRKLFWLFVAVSGFMVGVQLSEILFPYHAQWIQIAIAIAIGAAGAAVAILAQKMAFVFTGFMAGIYMVLIWVQLFGGSHLPVILFVFGGFIGAVAGYLFIDWAIIMLSSVIGAFLIIAEFHLSQNVSLISFSILTITGAVIQIRSMDNIEKTC